VAGSSDFGAGGVIAGIRNRLEVGVTLLDADNEFAGGDTELLANAKLNLFRETLTLPAFSVGILDAFDALDRDPSWYLVASKYLVRYFVRALTGQEIALKLHVGYGGGLYDQDLFAGAELFLPRGMSAMAEISNGEVNLGIRYHAGRFRATLGLFDLDHAGGGINYTAALH
jgi:hypothetical protein